jgi:hypothetical protein
VRKLKPEYFDLFNERQNYDQRDTTRTNCPTRLRINSSLSSKPLTHSQSIIVIITKAESHSIRSNLSAVKVEITAEGFPRALLFAAADAILVTGQPVSVGSRRRRTAAVVAAARGIDGRADAEILILIHPIGMAPIGHWTGK